MTFNFAPFAVDGARTTSALARAAVYTTGGGRSGVTKPADMRVQPLAVPGNGLRVTSGTATILNHYQSDPSEVYTVSNPSTHIVTSENMPPPAASLRYFLVCVVVGDPEFSQVGHPFMPGAIDPAAAAAFEYVRVVLVPCSAGTTSFQSLGLSYPGYALARLELPANTSTVTGPMLTNLRDLAQARTYSELLISRPNAEVRIDWDQNYVWFGPAPWVKVPPWATRMKCMVTLTAVVSNGNVYGQMRSLINGGPTGGVQIYDINGAGGVRSNISLLIDADVRAYAGQSVEISTQGQSFIPAATVYLAADVNTQYVHDVRFSEEPVA